MNASVHKKGNKWWVVEYLGRDPVTGKKRQKWHGSWATKREAQTVAARIITSRTDGSYVEPVKLTVAQYLERDWFPAVRDQVRPSTLGLYQTLASAYVVPRIGGIALQKLTPPTLNRLYADLRENGSLRTGGPLGAETTGKVHRLLHRALKDAVEWGFVARNVASIAKPPRTSRREMRVWSAEQVAAFLERAQNDDLIGLWVMLATTGLRRSEALGLRWQDVNLDDGWLSVRQTLAYVGTQPVLAETKTPKSRRLIQLAPETVAALRGHRARQLELRLKLGGTYDLELVFCDAEGEPLKPATVSRHFDRLVREAGLPRLTLHGLRHSWASLALLAGIDTKVVSEVLGHSSTNITADVYQHVSPGMQADATSRVAGLLKNAAGNRD